MPNEELTGKTILLVGASPGIGLAIAQRIKQEGAIVHLADINEALVQETASQVGATPHHVDGTDREAFRKTLGEIGRIDGLACIVATFVPPDSTGRISEADWRKTFEINLLSNMVVADEAARHMEKGSIVLVSSANAIVPKPGSYAYDTSKAALNHLIREFAVAFAPNVRVNGVAPATVVSGSQQFPRERVLSSLTKYSVAHDPNWDTERLREALANFYAERTLLKAAVHPAAVAEAVFLLLGDRLALTTGHILPVDGGLPEAFLR